MISLGLSFMLGSVFQEAMNPLLKNNMVDVLEWSFDTSWGLHPYKGIVL